VYATAVQLDDQALTSPHAIGLDPSIPNRDSDVQLRHRESYAVHEVDEEILQFAAGDAGRIAVEGGSERGRASPARVSGQKRLEFIGIEEAQDFSLIDRPFESVTIEHGRQVEQCSPAGGHRNSVKRCDLIRCQAVVMELDPRLGMPTAARRHLDQAPIGAPDAEVSRSGSIAQCGARSRREHRGHPSAFASEIRGTEGVHTTMHS
jgi:hypothetical protein